MPVADARDRLRGVFPERPVPEHVLLIETRVHLTERGNVVAEQLLGVHARERMAARDVIRYVEITGRVTLGRYEVRVFHKTEERHVAVGDVRPVRRAVLMA